jgi:hypothetical protein
MNDICGIELDCPFQGESRSITTIRGRCPRLQWLRPLALPQTIGGVLISMAQTLHLGSKPQTLGGFSASFDRLNGDVPS